MALSVFADKAHPPTEDELRGALGGAYAAWSALQAEVSARVPGIAGVWGFTSKSTGWGLRLRHKERVIVYMTPCAGHFLVSLALGEKAIAQALAAGLPDEVIEAIDAAPRYAEGRGFRVAVDRTGQVAALAVLALAKHENQGR